MSYQEPDLQQRKSLANAAKKALLEKFRAASADPALAERRAERAKIHEARIARVAERELARKKREAEFAEQAAREAELALQTQREAERLAAEETTRVAAEKAEQNAQLEAEQKAARDARYAARKAAKKKRRRGL